MIIDGKLILSFEKDPDSGQVTEWRGVWPERGSVLSLEFTLTPHIGRIVKDDDDDDRQKQSATNVDGTVLIVPAALLLVGCIVMCHHCYVAFHSKEKAGSSRTAGEAVVVPEPGGDA